MRTLNPGSLSTCASLIIEEEQGFEPRSSVSRGSFLLYETSKMPLPKSSLG